ncbi:MAG: DUF1153 domain-containing protein [Allosphingosinicella sp.]
MPSRSEASAVTEGPEPPPEIADIPVTRETLPPPDTRWVARRKAQVVKAVQTGLLSLDEALARYRLTIEEFASWQRALYRDGLEGLQIGQARVLRLVRRRREARDRRKALGARHG